MKKFNKLLINSALGATFFFSAGLCIFPAYFNKHKAPEKRVNITLDCDYSLGTMVLDDSVLIGYKEESADGSCNCYVSANFGYESFIIQNEGCDTLIDSSKGEIEDPDLGTITQLEFQGSEAELRDQYPVFENIREHVINRKEFQQDKFVNWINKHENPSSEKTLFDLVYSSE